MRELLTLLENLAMAEAAKKDPNAPSTLFAIYLEAVHAHPIRAKPRFDT